MFFPFKKRKSLDQEDFQKRFDQEDFRLKLFRHLRDFKTGDLLFKCRFVSEFCPVVVFVVFFVFPVSPGFLKTLTGDMIGLLFEAILIFWVF